MKGRITIALLILLVSFCLLSTACPPPQKPQESECISSVIYDKYLAEELNILRQFRDEFLSTSAPGNWFIRNYYDYSPVAVRIVEKHEALKILTKNLFADPAVRLVRLTESYWNKE